MSVDRQKLVGSITIDNEHIQFRSKGYGNWDLDVNTVLLIGEYTTQDGPMMEDYFVVMVTENRNEFEIPVNVKGFHDFLKEVARRMHVDISRKLMFSTDFASRVIAPISLEGHPLYIFEKEKKPFWKGLFTLSRMTRTLSPAVVDYIGRHPSQGERGSLILS
jgi:hypothetical protein